MADHFFSSPKVLQRLHLGPLGVDIDSFARLLTEQGYARRTAEEKIRIAADFSRWLDQQQLRIKDLDEKKISKFLLYRAQQGRTLHEERPTLRDLFKHLREAGIIPTPAPAVDDSTLHRIENSFARYLAEERGLTQATLDTYLQIARRFLSERFGSDAILLDKLTTQDITRFILRHAHTISPRRAQLMVTALRSFLRFLHQRGETATNLAKSVPTVANWRLSGLPKFLNPDEVERLLQGCDQSSPTGQRDYAVLLLLARLGLRAGEVVHMVLDDIDWETGQLIVRGKSAREDRLPLPQDVGEALATYLCHGRPRCLSRRVFIRMRAPHQGFSSSVAICNIVRRALARARLHPVRKGAHLLRHSLATQMIRQGASLAEIGEILRHQLPNTTEIYAKVDLVALSALAQPWPGGEL